MGGKDHHKQGHHDKGHQVESHHDKGHHVEGHHDKGHHVQGHHGQGHHDQHHHDPYARYKGTPLDFSKKHPVFKIQLDKKGPQFSEIDDRRAQYIRKYAGRVEVPLPQVPKNIPGLIAKTGPLPSTRRLWPRPSSSFERSGVFNIHTPNFNTRILFPFFFCFLLYGWWGHATYGLYKSRYQDNGQHPGNMYDKLNSRVPPVSKIWLRPG